MPLFEYICKKCGHHFEALVYGAKQPACPMCQSLELETVFSSFATSGSSKSGGASFGPGTGCGTGSGGG
jgi:putative FmdB family regulatory protein